MSSREAFEKYVEEGEYLALDRDPSGEYCDRETQSAWEGWQAATERAAKVCDAYDARIESEGGEEYQEELAGRQAGALRCFSAIREGNE